MGEKMHSPSIKLPVPYRHLESADRARLLERFLTRVEPT